LLVILGGVQIFFTCIGSGRVGLGQSADGLGSIGSHKINRRTTLTEIYWRTDRRTDTLIAIFGSRTRDKSQARPFQHGVYTVQDLVTYSAMSTRI